MINVLNGKILCSKYSKNCKIARFKIEVHILINRQSKKKYLPIMANFSDLKKFPLFRLRVCLRLLLAFNQSLSE